MPENFDQVARSPTKDAKIAGMRIAVQRFLDLKGQAVHAAAHIRLPRR